MSDLGGTSPVTPGDVTRVAEPGDLAPGGRPLVTILAPSTHTALDHPVADRTSVDIGSVVRGRFELESMIGEGGMGVVYRAIDRLHKEMQDRDPYVAIKILNSSLKRHPSALIALQRETRKAQLLAHENIINVHSFDRDGGVVYMTMELLDGKSLRTLVAEHPTGLPAAEAVPMIRSMAKALAYAHENEIVHSDFKPANVFLTRKQQIKVLDFGLARANPGAAEVDGGSLLDSPVLGGMTPAYASPEVLAGKEPTPADDVFGLAIVSFELLTGRHPFEYERVNVERLPAVKATPLPGLSRPQRLAIVRALEIEQSRRQKDAGEFLREFDGSSTLKRALQVAVAAAVLLPLAVYFVSQRDAAPAISFEDLPPEVRAEFDRAVSEGQTALSFGSAGINDALVFFSNAYELHPDNPRAVRGLEAVAGGFIASLPSADATTRAEAFGALFCNDYLSRYAPVATACDDLLGAAQCAAIAGRCQAPAAETVR